MNVDMPAAEIATRAPVVVCCMWCVYMVGTVALLLIVCLHVFCS